MSSVVLDPSRRYRHEVMLISTGRCLDTEINTLCVHTWAMRYTCLLADCPQGLGEMMSSSSDHHQRLVLGF